MQKYPVRASHRRNLEASALATIVRSHFEGVEATDGAITAHWGAIGRLSARAEKREIAIDLTMDPKVTEEVARETIARYNRFLEEATGFNSKERARRLRKSAQAGSAED